MLWSANYSLGVAVLARALQVIAPVLGPDFDIEITETHHSQKADAPSGTAKLLLEAVDPQHRLRPVYGREGNCGRREKDEVGIHALRGGTVAGTHTVHFFGPDEELELTHRAASRQIFVNGALHIARLLPGRPKGVYDLQKSCLERDGFECTGNHQLYRRFPKKTPVKIYVNLSAPVDFGSAEVFGEGKSRIVFGDWAELAPILEDNREKITDCVVENDRRNSGVPLLDLKKISRPGSNPGPSFGRRWRSARVPSS